ncbi:hypothetical protein V2J09_018763 [Rumex salicifolius]
MEANTNSGRSARRKVLRLEPRMFVHDHNHYDLHFSLISKIMVVAMTGMVIFGCAFPFFWRKKEIPDGSAPRDPSSKNSASFETNSVHKSTKGNPMRHIPQSPIRNPTQSPRRHPPQSPWRHLPQSPRMNPPSSPRFSPTLNKPGPLNLSFNIIVKATQSFSASSYMGEGGIGKVYKGRLPDGQEIAVQRARKEQFDLAEFNSEVEVLMKIDHRSLVKLLGYVDKGNDRLIVTEYLSSGTLRQHLDGDYGKILDFNQRLEASIDVAHGLTYLHMYAEKKIIHRDVKSSSILLTDTMRAKVADFWFARVGSQDTEHSHVMTGIKGTLGYLDPEYMRTHQLTPKSDVYSFGILLLEILTGRRPVDKHRLPEEKVLIQWVFQNYREGNFVQLVDPQMNEIVNEDILRRIFSVAIQCAAPIRADRPDMKEIIEGIGVMLIVWSQLVLALLLLPMLKDVKRENCERIDSMTFVGKDFSADAFLASNNLSGSRQNLIT